MKRILSTVLLALSLYNICIARTGGDTNIVGHVVDARTGGHLACITITIEGTTIGTATDASGHYMLTGVPAGRQRIKASMLGYESSTAEADIKSGATVAGVNVEGKAAFTRWFQLQLGVTAQRSRYKEPEVWSEDGSVPAERRLFRTPDLYGYFTATLTPLHDLTAALSGTYTGPMTVQHMAGSGTPTDVAVRTCSFFDMALKLSYDIHLYRNVTMQINAGVQNLFDACQRDFDLGADRDSGYVYGPSLPRSRFAGVKFSF